MLQLYIIYINFKTPRLVHVDNSKIDERIAKKKKRGGGGSNETSGQGGCRRRGRESNSPRNDNNYK